MAHRAHIRAPGALDSTGAHIPADALAMIGRRRTRRCQVTARDIRRYAQAIGENDPLYLDEERARRAGHHAMEAPPLFWQALAYDDVPPGALPADGSPVELDVAIPAQRTVGGSSEYALYRRARAGETITITTELKDLYVKRGRSGLLYFVVVETRFDDDDGEPVARELATYIKRM